MITLKQLQHMRAIRRYGTLHEAAANLHITVPALSRSLRALEERFQLRLFDRTQSGMQPTAFLERIEERSEQLILEAQELEREARLYRDRQSGALRIGIGKAAKEWVLRSVLPTFFEQNPGIRLEIEEGSVGDLVEGLKSRHLDLVLAGFESYQSVDALAFDFSTDIDSAVLVRQGHPLISDQPVTPQRLTEYPMLAATKVSTTHPFPNQLMEHFGVRLQSQVLCSDYATLESLLRHSEAWLPAPAPAFKKQLDNGELHRLDVTGWDLTIRLSAIELKTRSREPAADSFVQWCQALLSPA